MREKWRWQRKTKGGQGKDEGTYLSMTCITPFETIISAIVTIAASTKTFPLTASTATSVPIKLGNVSFANPVIKRGLYPTVPLITWYSRILVSWVLLNEEVAEPIRWKAAFEGAKIVTSLRESTAETRFAFVRAPAREVNWESIADIAGLRGRVRTVSRIWITPPVNITSCFAVNIIRGLTCKWERVKHTAVVTLLISFNPLINSTVFPLKTPITTWPPVTFVNVVLVNSVGTNCSVVVKEVDGKEPFRTWYWSKAAIMPASFSSAMPAEVDRILLNASFEGARIVIGDAEARAEERAGWDAKRPVFVVSLLL
jgi:hypothetical protein